MIVLLALLACGDPDAPQGLEARADAPARPTDVAAPAALPDRFGLGREPTAAEIAAVDVEVSASWAGLPPGRGTVAEGRALYAQKCAACHGPDAKGGPGWLGPTLIATEPLDGFEKDWRIPKSIGNWWPHASTVWDYVHRSMPQTAPGSLTDDETYALVAFLLAENRVVPADWVADPDALRAVQMPTRMKFVPDDRDPAAGFR